MKAQAGVMEWQPFVTITSNDDEIIQHQSLWLDTQGFRYVILQVLIVNLSANYFYIETSESTDGPWTTVGGNGVGRFQANSVGETEIALSSELPQSDPYCLRRYLRWRSGDNNKTVSFRIRAELKL